MIGRYSLWVLGSGLLVGVLALNVANLTTTPHVFGDESWVTSIIWSASEGMGFKPAIAAGAGLYDGIPDYSSPRLALLPNVMAELVLPTSVELHRGIVLLTAIGALGFFWNGMRRLMDGGSALVATAALASTWAFFYMSHFIRWDAVGLVILCALLSLLAAGPPSLRRAAIAGLLVGMCFDFSQNVAAVFPGVLLLCVWEPERRWHRLGALFGGVAVGAGVAFVSHFAPGFDFSQAREQTDLFLRPQSGYLDTPILEAVEHLSLNPILDDPQRYDHLTFGSYRVNLVFLSIGLVAGILTMLQALRVPVGLLRIAGLTALSLVALTLALAGSAYTVLGDAMGPLLLIAVGVASWLAVDGIRGRREYPQHAVPGVLLSGMLLGWALIIGFEFGVYTGFGVVFSVAAVASALRGLSPESVRDVAPGVALAAVTVASTLFVMGEIDLATEEPALDPELSATAKEIVPEGDTVLGEWVYWFLYEDERFRANSVLWQQLWNHPEEDLEDAFHRVCPDYVLLDDVWLARYLDLTAQRRFPNLAPTDPDEERKLRAFLRTEYRPIERIVVDGTQLTFWRRAAPSCPSPPPT